MLKTSGEKRAALYRELVIAGEGGGGSERADLGTPRC